MKFVKFKTHVFAEPKNNKRQETWNRKAEDISYVKEINTTFRDD